MKKIIITLIFSIFISLSWAQDFNFTQKYFQPQVFSPAFTAINAGLQITNSNQMSSNTSTGFLTYSLGTEYFSEKYSSGFGFYFLSDQSFSKLSSYNEIALNYAFEFALISNIKARAGINGKYVSTNINFDNLLFVDQLSPTGSHAPVSFQAIHELKVSYVDFATSILIYNEKIWLGGNLAHLTKPSISITGSLYKLPISSTIFGGVNFFFNEDKTRKVVLTADYSQQSNINLFSTMGYIEFDKMYGGFGWRGMPFNDIESVNKLNVISALVGISFGKYQVTYSYDFSAISVFNYNELTLSMRFKNNNRFLF